MIRLPTHDFKRSCWPVQSIVGSRRNGSQNFRPLFHAIQKFTGNCKLWRYSVAFGPGNHLLGWGGGLKCPLEGGLKNGLGGVELLFTPFPPRTPMIAWCPLQLWVFNRMLHHFRDSPWITKYPLKYPKILGIISDFKQTKHTLKWQGQNSWN